MIFFLIKSFTETIIVNKGVAPVEGDPQAGMRTNRNFPTELPQSVLTIYEEWLIKYSTVV